jgi:hypothetical protein
MADDGFITLPDGTKVAGAEIEIVEQVDREVPVLRPNMVRFRMNGQEILLPRGAELVINPIKLGASVPTATITVFVKSLSIHREDKPDASA